MEKDLAPITVVGGIGPPGGKHGVHSRVAIKDAGFHGGIGAGRQPETVNLTGIGKIAAKIQQTAIRADECFVAESFVGAHVHVRNQGGSVGAIERPFVDAGAAEIGVIAIAAAVSVTMGDVQRHAADGAFGRVQGHAADAGGRVGAGTEGKLGDIRNIAAVTPI